MLRVSLLQINAMRVLLYFYIDKNLLKKSGRIQITVDLGEEYGFTDVDG